MQQTYITSETALDDAVVVKFGLNIPNTINLFSDSYANVTADVDGKKNVAPGTSGQYTFVVTGTSEVAYKVSATISVIYSDKWGDYAPLKFSISGEDWIGLEDFKTNLSAVDSAAIEPNEAYISVQTIYWQ